VRHGRKQAAAPISGRLLACRVSFLRGSVRRLFGPGFAGSALGVSEPEAVAVHFEDMDVMREAIEERTG
jgi:hypothetical protein